MNKSNVLAAVLGAILTILSVVGGPIIYNLTKITFKLGSPAATNSALIWLNNQIDAEKQRQVQPKQ